MSYTFVHNSRNVVTIEMPYRKSFEQWFLLTADRHWDNPKSNWYLQKKHLNLAKRRGAGIIDVGDLFCAMQGKADPRGDKSSVRPMHQRGDYFDSLVQTAADFFEPFAHNFILIGRGNHEQKILERRETDLIARLAKELNTRTGSHIQSGGYTGWVIFKFEGADYDLFKKMWYFHGHGGGGPVTKGVIQTNRRAVYLPDADFVISGHIHEDWNVSLSRARCLNDGTTFLDEQEHVQIPTYKDEYDDGYDGWHVETGKPPKPIGAVWLRFRRKGKGPIEYDFHKAR